MVKTLAAIFNEPPARRWIVGQTPRQAALDMLNLLVRTALLTICGACW